MNGNIVHRAVGRVDLVVQGMRQAVRVAELMNGEPSSPRIEDGGIDVGVSQRESQSVRRFHVELYVVVENRSRLVEACGKLDVTIAVDIGGDGDPRSDIGICVRSRGSFRE